MLRDPSGYQRVGPLALAPGLLREMGADCPALLAGSGLEPDALDLPEAGIPYLAAGEFLYQCARRTACPHFGVLLGRRVTWRSLGVVGALMRNAPTLGEMLRDLVANHNRYVEGGVFYLFPLEDAVLLGYAVYQAGGRGAAEIGDLIVAASCQILRDLGFPSPLEVLLARDRPVDVASYDRHFQAPVRFAAEMSGLVLARRTLATVTAGADPAVRADLQRRVDAYWAAGQPDVVSRVRRALFPDLMLGTATLAEIANRLALPPRTLSRRLKAGGTSFRDELEQVRFEIARQLLANTSIPITQIGLALDYAALSVFTRAFRRWAGTPPGTWRAAHHAGRPALEIYLAGDGEVAGIVKHHP